MERSYGFLSNFFQSKQAPSFNEVCYVSVLWFFSMIFIKCLKNSILLLDRIEVQYAPPTYSLWDTIDKFHLISITMIKTDIAWLLLARLRSQHIFEVFFSSVFFPFTPETNQNICNEFHWFFRVFLWTAI